MVGKNLAKALKKGKKRPLWAFTLQFIFIFMEGEKVFIMLLDYK